MDIEQFIDDLESLDKSLKTRKTNLEDLRKNDINKLEGFNSSFIRDTILRPYQYRIHHLRKTVQVDHEQRRRELINQVIKMIGLDIPSITIQRLINLLRQQKSHLDQDPSSKPNLIYLQHRQKLISNVIEKELLSTLVLDHSHRYKVVLGIMHDYILPALSLYQTMFDDIIPVIKFALYHIDWFLSAIKEILKSVRTTSQLGEWWNRVVIIDSGFALLQYSFLHLVEPIFIHQANLIISNAALMSLNSLKSKSAEALFQPSNRNRTTQTEPLSQDYCSPPKELLEFPQLVILIDSLIDLLELIKPFPLPFLINGIRELFASQCQEYRQLLCKKFNEEDQIFKVFDTHIPPFIFKVLDRYSST